MTWMKFSAVNIKYIKIGRILHTLCHKIYLKKKKNLSSILNEKSELVLFILKDKKLKRCEIWFIIIFLEHI